MLASILDNQDQLSPQTLFTLLGNRGLDERTNEFWDTLTTKKAFLAIEFIVDCGNDDTETSNLPNCVSRPHSEDNIDRSSLASLFCWLLRSKTLDEISEKMAQGELDPNRDLKAMVLEIWREIPEYKKYIKRVSDWYVRATNNPFSAKFYD